MFIKHQLYAPLLPGWNHPLHGLNHQHAEVPHIYPSNSDFFSKLYTWTANFLLVNPAGCLTSQQVRMELAISPSSPQTMFSYVLAQRLMLPSTYLLVRSRYPIFTNTYLFSSKLCLNLCLPFCLSNHPWVKSLPFGVSPPLATSRRARMLWVPCMFQVDLPTPWLQNLPKWRIANSTLVQNLGWTSCHPYQSLNLPFSPLFRGTGPTIATSKSNCVLGHASWLNQC